MNTKGKLIDFIYAAFFAALTAVLGFVSIPLPFSPVPVSGQSMGIMLAGSMLTARQAGFSVLTFILIGAIGIPVFSGFAGGVGVVLGPRGGYYFGFLIGTVVIALLKGTNNNPWRLALANSIGGIIFVYLFGILWLSFITGMGIQKAFMAGALPFIPGDLFKAFSATIIGVAINKRLRKCLERLS
ncbi:MAG: BioY protein [Firmicutes bacterium]|nr:BioY protein [Bacillota bacterium]